MGDILSPQNTISEFKKEMDKLITSSSDELLESIEKEKERTEEIIRKKGERIVQLEQQVEQLAKFENAFETARNTLEDIREYKLGLGVDLAIKSLIEKMKMFKPEIDSDAFDGNSIYHLL